MINQEFLIAKFCGRFIKGGKYPIIILGSVENVVNSISNGANLSTPVSFKEESIIFLLFEEFFRVICDWLSDPRNSS